MLRLFSNLGSPLHAEVMRFCPMVVFSFTNRALAPTAVGWGFGSSTNEGFVQAENQPVDAASRAPE